MDSIGLTRRQFLGQSGAVAASAAVLNSRGADGSVQPAPTDPQIAGKHTYWESNGQITRDIRLS